MVMVPLAGNTEAVVNATVVTPEVAFCATLSPAASVSDAPVTCPPMAGEALGALVTSALVCTVTPAATDSLGDPVVSCPAAKVIFCSPAGSRGEPLAMVHTIVRPAAVIAQDAVSTAEPDAGTSKPCGEPAPEK